MADIGNDHFPWPRDSGVSTANEMIIFGWIVRNCFEKDASILEVLCWFIVVWELGGHSEIQTLEAGAGRGLAGYTRAPLLRGELPFAFHTRSAGELPGGWSF